MNTLTLLGGLEFDEERPRAEPLLVRGSGRVLRFALKPYQRVSEHCAPHSPVHIVVLKGHGKFAGADGREELLGPDDLAVFGAGERHTVRALDEALVFVAFLHPVPGVPESKRPPKTPAARTPHPAADTYLTWHM